ncbi:inactive ubiquitin carboxyl-terminal hydrolase 53 isoform X1 [Hemibagrus wyckioides]|uniref:inactive ubiquitin carboxyl-terminal hydrolase 53 isoform X1 n=1 Tax=Hemibagrus wyckioides TaxID=337641 RepID=UPI00266BBC02|nr:inactive ubiquitin carboxyl-terminal hydrolase 53 isoform X1 [Hemibagrus wyckioides]
MAWAKFFRKPGSNLGRVYQPGSMLSLAPTKGLLNEPGQNSCFLNSAVQVLWQLDIFRRSLRQVPNHNCLGEACIFCALKGIFSQFQDSRERALPSDNLRIALAETFKDEQRFQLGFMDDAAECFENILQRIHQHIVNDDDTDACTSKVCITHQKFAMTLYEQTVCQSCGASSDPLPFTQLVNYVSTTALCQQFLRRREERPRPDMFGELLRAANTIGDQRECPSKCGQVIKIRRVLMNSPEIVTIGFVWDSEQSDETENVVRSLSPHLNLSGVFYHVTDEQAQKSDLQLVGMICYTSKHYCAFAFHTKSSKWFFFDDATVKEVGSKWKDVVTKCIRGHFQPLLLFYSDPEGSAVRGAEVPRSDSSASHNKPSVNGEIPGTPQPGGKKLELTRENLSAMLSSHGTLKQKSQPLSTFKRGTNQTSGGRGPVKMSSDPKGFLRELSREVAREARNINIIKRDNDKSHQRPETPRQGGTASERSYSRSLSPPENGFKNTESRLYRSQGRGPTRAERSPRTNRRVAHAPRSHSQPRIPVQPPSSNVSSRNDFSNGYDTDSSYDSRERPNGASRTHTNRGWKPMRQVLNVDSILSNDNEHHLPSLGQQTSGQRRLPYERESRTAREDSKPKSLMTIYEDEQRHELGSRTFLESESRERERTKGTVNHFTQKKENWKNQRIESGYESSDRLSNGSASLDSPVVDNVGAKELRRVPDLHLLRDPDYQRRYEDSKADGSQTPFSFGELQGKTHEYNLRLNRRDRTDGVNGSSGTALFSKTSSSDWNSSDDLAGPVSEQEDSLSQTDVSPLVHHQPVQSPSQSSPPPLPPKPQALRSENRRDLIQDFTQTRPKSPAYRGGTLSKMSSEIWLENSEPNMLSSSDSSSKSGSSDQERNDLSASESEDKCPSNPDCYVEPTVTGEYAIPTTYFSVDSCMTDTYRAKYHKKRSALHAASDSKTGEHTSSSESDHGDTASPSPADLKIPDLYRTKKDTAHTSNKPIVKWNPVSVKGLDEHGFL